MNAKLLGKLSLLAILAAASFLATSAVLARDRPKKGAVAPQAVAEAPILPMTIVPNQSTHRPQNASSGSTSMESVRVQPAGRGFRIFGRAVIREFRSAASFVWSVRVRDPVRHVLVAEQRYDTQVFQVPGDTHELRPTFEDTFSPSLPAGAYKIELVLYEVPPGGVALLDDPSIAEHQLMAKNTVAVTVEP